MEKNFKIEEFIRTNKRINKLSAGQAIKLNEIERKFIIMSRISVALHRKGLTTNLYLSSSNEYCSLTVHLYNKEKDESCIVNDVDSSKITEKELLHWWEVIGG